MRRAERRRDSSGRGLTLRAPVRASSRKVWTPSTGQSAAIKRTLRVLDVRLMDPPSRRELARIAGMGRSQFSYMFHAVAGTPLPAYICDLRLKRAQRLMRTSRTSLRIIAKDAGFYDLPHLSKAFRKRFGMSPSQFRAKNARGRPRRGILGSMQSGRGPTRGG